MVGLGGDGGWVVGDEGRGAGSRCFGGIAWVQCYQSTFVDAMICNRCQLLCTTNSTQKLLIPEVVH